MRILFLLPRFVGGGAELMSADIANRLAGRGHDVSLVAAVEGPDRRFFDLRVPVRILGTRSLLASARMLAEENRAFGTEAVIAVLPVANLVADLSKMLWRHPAKVVNTWHGYWGSARGAKGRAAHLGVGLLSRMGDANVAVSHDLARHLVRFGAARERMTVIYNGCALSAGAEPHRHPRPYVFTAGSLTEHKNHRDLIRAFARFRERFDWDLLIAGRGPLDAELRASARDHGVDQSVHFLGFQKDLRGFYAGAEMFVLSSRVESFGIVAVEALAAGIPVVATDCGGPREILADGRFGRLVPVGDIAAMAEAMCAAASEAPPRAELTARAHMFDIECAVCAYEDLCRNLLSGARVLGDAASSISASALAPACCRDREPAAASDDRNRVPD